MSLNLNFPASYYYNREGESDKKKIFFAYIKFRVAQQSGTHLVCL